MTIKEIAMLAGVSKTTVSRVINDSPLVNETTKKKVLRIISDYSFEPSLVAKALSKNESSTIGVIIPELDNEFFPEVLSGINEVADLHNVSMICCDTNDDVNQENIAIRTLSQQRVKGIIITPAVERAFEFYKPLLTLNVPVVLLDRHIPDAPWDGVYYDDFNSAYAATNALINEGYQHIGIVTGDLKLQIGRERFEGYKAAMKKADLELDERYIKYGDFSVDTAYRLASEMFESKNIPEAILTSNNRTTIGLFKAARKHSIRLCHDMALIGIDRIALFDDLGFPFSCVSRDTKQMGKEAANLLFQKMNDMTATAKKVYIMPYSLKLNGSEKKDIDLFNYKFLEK